MIDFLTLEDINTAVALGYNEPFWDTVVIDTGNDADFTDIKFDYCNVSREKQQGGTYKLWISVQNELWKDYYYFIDANGEYVRGGNPTITPFTVISDTSSVTCHFLLNGPTTIKKPVPWHLEVINPKVIVKGVETDFLMHVFSHTGENLDNKYFTVSRPNGSSSTNVKCVLYKGNYVLNFPRTVNDDYLLVSYDNLEYKVYFKSVSKQLFFSPVGSVVAGQVNHVRLNAPPNYNYNEQNIRLVSDYPISNITKNSTYNFLTFDLDLRSKTDTKPVKINIQYKLNQAFPVNQTVRFECTYTPITDITGLTNLLNGGIGILGADITLTDNLTITNNVTLIGDNHNIDLNSYQITVPEDKTLTLKNINFANGEQSILQKLNSTVELTDCTFTTCTSETGYGSVITCDVDLTSLTNPSDFKTIIQGCTFTDCDSIIFHGGELKVTNSIVNGKIGDYSYPYFLYQTDGEAVITQTQFTITNEEIISEDIKFNSCIFICGENATINGLDYTELQANNNNRFLENNSSIIDLTYYYEPTEENITLTTDNGYCHAVSGKSRIYKTNVEITRSE